LRLASESLNGLLVKTITRNFDSLRRDAGFQVGQGNTDEFYTKYGYDNVNRLASVIDMSGTFNYGFTPNSASNLRASLTGPALSGTWTYEPGRDALTTVANMVGQTTVSSYNYQVNAIGQRNNVVQSGAAFGTAAFSRFLYDTTGELTDAKRYLGADPGNISSPVGSWRIFFYRYLQVTPFEQDQKISDFTKMATFVFRAR